MVKVPKGRILAVDDEAEIRELLTVFLTSEGYEVTCFESAAAALAAVRSADNGDSFDIVISDLGMAQMDGMQLLKTLKSERPALPVIVITGDRNVDTAIEAMRNGAFHYVVKPFKLNELSVHVERAMEKRVLALDVLALRKEVHKNWELHQILGKSAGMKGVFDLIRRVAPSTANVLIRGESGTGKEMVARAIHALGPRADKPFVAINCTAIPETLLESELFGHAKGSFTGAANRKKGLIEEADGGTLFLDEIGDMSPVLQAKLLRVLQEKKIRPVGENTLVDVDVRIVAATHKDLKVGIREGTFREDLFYRLSVIPIQIPPLRERTEDIPLLAEHFLQKYVAENITLGNDKRIRGFTKAALGKLIRLKWPGNVRELQNVIERAVVLCGETYIDDKDLPDPEGISPDEAYNAITKDFPTLAQMEERYIRVVIEKTAGRKDRAAQILGINRRTLYRKEHEYGLSDGAPDESELGEGT